MQVRGGKEVTLTPGQTFYEGPEDVHVVGRNASQTKPAKFVVFFVKNIAQSATEGSTVRLSPVLMQPMVSDDVAAAVADVALREPLNAMLEVAGPDKIRQDELVRQFLTATGDPRKVVTDANAGYYGIKVNDQSLVPGDNPRLGSTHFSEWLSRTTS